VLVRRARQRCDRERRYALAVGVFVFGVVLDLRGSSVGLDRLDALLSGSLRLVALAAGDDLPVGCLEVEPEISGFALENLETSPPSESPLIE
jgi:hypothetical protein